jgi:hypothetical protein
LLRYTTKGKRCNEDVAVRNLIQLEIDSEGIKDKATQRILEVTRAAPSLDQFRLGINAYEWDAASSHWHKPQLGAIKYRIVILPDRDILRKEWEPVLEALDELLGGALDRNAWSWSQAFYFPSCLPENQGYAFFVHNQGTALPVDKFVGRGREMLEAKRAFSAKSVGGTEWDKGAERPALLAPSVDVRFAPTSCR